MFNHHYFYYTIIIMHDFLMNLLTDGHGNWSDQGCYKENETDDTVVCICNHLTTFALIMVGIIILCSRQLTPTIYSMYCCFFSMSIHHIYFEFLFGRMCTLFPKCMYLFLNIQRERLNIYHYWAMQCPLSAFSLSSLPTQLKSMNCSSYTRT